MKKKIEKEIIGTWEGISCTYKNEKGKKIDYYGEKYKGLVIYDNCGYIAAQQTKGDRSLFTGSPMAFTSSPEECKNAFDSYQAYFAKYKFDYENNAVIHTVIAAQRPNWVGHKEIRYPKIKGDILIMKTPPIQIEHTTTVFTLKFRRASKLKLFSKKNE